MLLLAAALLALLIAHMLVGTDRLLFLLLVLLFFVFFVALIVLFHHELDLCKLFGVQVDAHLLSDRDQIWRDFLCAFFVVVVLDLHFIVVILLLVFSNDFSNFAVYFIIQVLVRVLFVSVDLLSRMTMAPSLA